MDLRAKAKNDFGKDFFELMNNLVGNVRKHKDIKHGTTNRRSSHLVSTKLSHQQMVFLENLLVMEMSKVEVAMGNLVYLGPSVLEISKIAMHEYWYGYIKPKYGDEVLCYMDTGTINFLIKSENNLC